MERTSVGYHPLSACFPETLREERLCRSGQGWAGRPRSRRHLRESVGRLCAIVLTILEGRSTRSPFEGGIE